MNRRGFGPRVDDTIITLELHAMSSNLYGVLDLQDNLMHHLRSLDAPSDLFQHAIQMYVLNCS